MRWGGGEAHRIYRERKRHTHTHVLHIRMIYSPHAHTHTHTHTHTHLDSVHEDPGAIERRQTSSHRRKNDSPTGIIESSLPNDVISSVLIVHPSASTRGPMSMMPRFLERERERKRKRESQRGREDAVRVVVVKFSKTMETAINCRGECFRNVFNPHKGLANLLKRLLKFKCPEISL